MAAKAKLIIDGKEINVLSFSFNIHQGSDTVGRPSSKPVFTGLNVVVEGRKGVGFTSWLYGLN